MSREIKFKFWDNELKKICERKPAYNDFNHKNIIPLQFTGLYDKAGKKVFEGDLLYTKDECPDEGIIESESQVFWNEHTASFHLDNSYSQDKSCSTELWQELNDFEYLVTGNIYQKSKLWKKAV